MVEILQKREYINSNLVNNSVIIPLSEYNELIEFKNRVEKEKTFLYTSHEGRKVFLVLDSDAKIVKRCLDLINYYRNQFLDQFKENRNFRKKLDFFEKEFNIDINYCSEEVLFKFKNNGK